MNNHLLERTIGHEFADASLLELALTHPSYALAHKCQDNQRLEFLGDAVLEICVSRVLYHKFPKLKEGQLTRRRASLVCEANLAEAARRFGLGAFLKLDRGEEVVGGRENPSILADTMEAVIAAVYLDAGMDKAAALVDLAMGDYESAAKATGANGVALWESYVAGLDPTDPTSRFTASIAIGTDGKPLITWKPALKGERIYRICGKKDLSDATWTADIDPKGGVYRFYKITVELVK